MTSKDCLPNILQPMLPQRPLAHRPRVDQTWLTRVSDWVVSAQLLQCESLCRLASLLFISIAEYIPIDQPQLQQGSVSQSCPYFDESIIVTINPFRVLRTS
jgi:cytochrome c biogenesis factor